jgi:hypothetical protein
MAPALGAGRRKARFPQGRRDAETMPETIVFSKVSAARDSKPAAGLVNLCGSRDSGQIP